MKISPGICIAALIFSTVCVAENGIPIYPVRDIDPKSDKFRKVIRTVSDQLYERQIKQLDMQNVEILQSVGEQTYRVAIGAEFYVLKIPGSEIYPDGEILSLPVSRTKEVFRYSSFPGGLKTLRVLKVGDIPARLSSDEVVLQLQAGVKFPIVMGDKVVKCHKCHGLGSIGGVDSKKCPDCKGSRREKVANAFLVVW